MARINIPFNTWSEERLATGQKLATSRNKKYGEKQTEGSASATGYSAE